MSFPVTTTMIASAGTAMAATHFCSFPFYSPVAAAPPPCCSSAYPSSFGASTSAGSIDCNVKSRLFMRQQLTPEAAVLKERCECHDLFKELVPYVRAWKWQKEMVDTMCAAVTRGEEPSTSVLLLQHPPVYTMGTRSSDRYLRFDKENPPFEVHRTERGGEVTYHGPGQLVMYPILNLRHHKMDLHWYLRMLEEVVIRALWSACGLEASRIDGLTGVWVGDVKVAAIGVRVSRWITYHGLALNVNTDLTPFQNIVPCGIDDRPVGSIQQLLKSGESHEDEHFAARGSNVLSRSWQETESGSHRTDKASKMFDTKTQKTVWDEAMLLQHVHSSLLAEFAEVFQVQLVPPTRDSPKALSQISIPHPVSSSP